MEIRHPETPAPDAPGPGVVVVGGTVEEFGVGDNILHLLRYWTKGRRQAQSAKRHRVGKGREEGGQYAEEPDARLDLPGMGDGPRGRLTAPAAHLDPHGQETPTGPAGPRFHVRSSVKPGSELRRHPDIDKSKPAPPYEAVPVERLTTEESRPALAAAGWSEKRIKEIVGRGVVYQVQAGRNPAFVFIANPDAMVATKTDPQRNAHRAALHAMKEYEDENSVRLHFGFPEEAEHFKQLKLAVAEKRAALDGAVAAYQAVFGVGGDEAVGDWEDGIAREAGSLLAGRLAVLPPWRREGWDGKPSRFMVQFDETKLMVQRRANDPDSDKAVNGNTERGHEMMMLDRALWRISMDEAKAMKMEVGDMMSSGRQTFGHNLFAHEFAHLLDTTNEDDPWHSAQFGALWAALKAAGARSVYGDTNAREMFAEVLASVDEKPNTLIGFLMRNFLMMKSRRPDHPPPGWEAAHIKWLHESISAVEAGRRPGKLPST